MTHTRAEIITIGDEILYGQILDTNSQWISQQLDELGIRVVRKVTIGDNETDILYAFARAQKNADLVLITGGLGPTNDDLTKPLLAKHFGVEIKISEQALKEVTELFRKFGKELTPTNRTQAELPVNCTIISNKLGSAPGMWFDENDTVFVSMPGVPFEMKGMMTEIILPRIKKRFQTRLIYHKIIKTTGIGESWLSDKIKSWEEQLPEHIKLAYLPSIMEVKLRLTASGYDKNQLIADVEKEIGKLKPLAGKYIFGYNDDTLEKVVGEMLRSKGITIATAESCTGGFLSHKLTSVPGSSDYFLGGIVSYSNKIKVTSLGVNEETLNKYGAVSEQTVNEMARNVRKIIGTDIGVAISGVAGPAGGTSENPVGTVWVAVSDNDQTRVLKFSFAKNRMVNIEASAKVAMNMVRQRLAEYEKDTP